MKSQNPALLSVKFIAQDLAGNLLYWPVWWYSRGLVDFISRRLRGLKEFEEDIGLTVWLMNWGKPMYGQYDIAGKIISFIMRTAGIFFKIIQLMIMFIIELVLIAVWLGLPILVVWQLWRYAF